jgi:hypothetical protein
LGCGQAHAHGIAGNRFFPGTLTFDDPAVADEAIVPLYSTFKRPAVVGDGDVVDNSVNWSIFRLLTPKVGMGVDSGWISRNWGGVGRSGFDITRIDLKGEVYRTISMRCWYQPGQAGVSGIRAPRESRPMHQI